MVWPRYTGRNVLILCPFHPPPLHHQATRRIAKLEQDIKKMEKLEGNVGKLETGAGNVETSLARVEGEMKRMERLVDGQMLIWADAAIKH